MLSRIRTSVGLLEITVSDRGVRSIRFLKGAKAIAPSTALLRKCARQLEEYVRGKRKSFDVPLDVTGPAFYRMVWNALRNIPHGTTLTYGELAKKIGRPSAARAVGQAVGANPVCIMVPCHRVVAADGLGGFAYGRKAKESLLALEGSVHGR